MPLVTVTLAPGYRLPHSERTASWMGEARTTRASTRNYVQVLLPASLPGLIVDNADALSIDPKTPKSGVQVLVRDFEDRDVNTVGVWVKATFAVSSAEELPTQITVQRVRHQLWDLLHEWFTNRDLEADSLALDVFWVVAAGCGTFGDDNTLHQW